MTTKRVCFGIVLVLLFLQLPIFAAAAQPEYTFDLRVDGKTMETAQKGDIITISLYVQRTDSDEPFTMYAMQSEIAYSSNFRLVEGSVILKEGVQSRDIATTDGNREFYINYLSMDGGALWDSRTLVGSFQLEAIGDSGTTYIENRDYLIPSQDGTDSYPSSSNSVIVEILPEEPEQPDVPEEPEEPDVPEKPDRPDGPKPPHFPTPPESVVQYTVRFDTQGGSFIPEQIVHEGQKIKRPSNPVKEGCTFAGWYEDPECTDRWHFARDKVHENMTLYAKWISGAYDLIPDTSDKIGYICVTVMALSGAAVMVMGELCRRKRRQ